MNKDPEILLDIVSPSPQQQQKIIDMVTKLLAGGFLLWMTSADLINEISKLKQPKSGSSAKASLS